MTAGDHGSRSRPRIALASRLFAPEPAAASFRLLAAARALVATGSRVTVLTSRAAATSANIPDTAEAGITTRRWPVLRDKDGAVRGYLPYASFDIPVFFRLLFSRRQDAVLVEPPPTTGCAVRAALALRRTPYAYYAADLVSAAAAGAGYPRAVVGVARLLEGIALRGAAVVLAVNDHVAQEVRHLGVQPARIRVVGNGVDTEVFTPLGPVESPAGGARRGPGSLFVYAGSMNDIHGAGVFIEAFRLALSDLPGATLVMVGRGSEAGTVRELGTRLPSGSFVFQESLPGPQVAALMRGATAGLASIRPMSGYSFALATKAVAVAATGTPVIFAGEGETASIVTKGNLGWAVPWEASAIAEAMRIAARSPHAPGRVERAQWVYENASLTSVGRDVAAAVASIIDRR